MAITITYLNNVIQNKFGHIQGSLLFFYFKNPRKIKLYRFLNKYSQLLEIKAIIILFVKLNPHKDRIFF